MAIICIPRIMLAVCLSTLLVLRTSAQNAAPINDTSGSGSNVQFVLDTTLNNMQDHVAIYPLTGQAGQTGSISTIQSITPTGPLVLTNARTVASLAPGDIAYISCEPGDYTGSIGSTKIINMAINNKPSAVVLYSTFAAQCSLGLPNGFTYTSLYTMVDANSSEAVASGLGKANPPFPQSSLHVNQSSLNGTSNGGDNGNVLGHSPTTAVAMIILYSITGIITALFLIIIVVGAIRAHRHPERYGPRHIRGRVRQSRAKGIARAMLETIPIVKFGDMEEDKPVHQGNDVELGTTTAEHRENAAIDAGQPREAESVPEAESTVASGPDIVKTEAATGPAQSKEDPTLAGSDNSLACSVCTEDFIKGQDIRVLPCKHKFHPECIDPWLLNVSGTCPLCRVDLHPTTSNAISELNTRDEIPQTAPNDSSTATETHDETTHRHRPSRILHTLNIGRMRQATPEERIAALMRLRRENEATLGTQEQRQANIERPRNGFSARLSRAFGSRPASGAAASRPVSDAPAVAVTPSVAAQAHGAAEMPSTETEPEPDRRRQGSFAG